VDCRKTETLLEDQSFLNQLLTDGMNIAVVREELAQHQHLINQKELARIIAKAIGEASSTNGESLSLGEPVDSIEVQEQSKTGNTTEEFGEISNALYEVRSRVKFQPLRVKEAFGTWEGADVFDEPPNSYVLKLDDATRAFRLEQRTPQEEHFWEGTYVLQKGDEIVFEVHRSSATQSIRHFTARILVKSDWRRTVWRMRLVLPGLSAVHGHDDAESVLKAMHEILRSSPWSKTKQMAPPDLITADLKLKTNGTNENAD